MCEKLEEEKYDQNRTLWKLQMIPVKSWRSQEKVKRLFSTSLNISHEQLQDLLTHQWIEDKYDEVMQKNQEKKRSVLLGEILRINALVEVDTALDNMVANSSQFVQEFFLLVNHLLGSLRIGITISDILM